MFIKLPVEIIMEIYSYLTQDQIYLSRVCWKLYIIYSSLDVKVQYTYYHWATEYKKLLLWQKEAILPLMCYNDNNVRILRLNLSIINIDLEIKNYLPQNTRLVQYLRDKV